MYGLSLEPKEKVEQEPERAERHYEKAEKPHREPREKREPRRHEREPREIKEREPVPAVAEAEPAAEPEPFEEEPTKHLSETQIKFRDMINELGSTSKAKILGADMELLKEVPVRELVNTLKADATGVVAVVFDGIITQRILDIASDKKISTIVGTKMGNITKQPTSVDVWSKDDLNE
jgi:DNA primase